MNNPPTPIYTPFNGAGVNQPTSLFSRVNGEGGMVIALGIAAKMEGSPIVATKPLHGAIFTKHQNGRERLTITEPTTAAYRHAHKIAWAQHKAKLRGEVVAPVDAVCSYLRVCAAIDGLELPEPTRQAIYAYYGKL